MYPQPGEETLVQGNQATLKRVAYPITQTYRYNHKIWGIAYHDVVMSCDFNNVQDQMSPNYFSVHQIISTRIGRLYELKIPTGQYVSPIMITEIDQRHDIMLPFRLRVMSNLCFYMVINIRLLIFLNKATDTFLL